MLPTIAIPTAIITIGIIILAPLKFSTFDMKALGDVFNNLKDISHSFSQRRRRGRHAVGETGGGSDFLALGRLQEIVSVKYLKSKRHHWGWNMAHVRQSIRDNVVTVVTGLSLGLSLTRFFFFRASSVFLRFSHPTNSFRSTRGCCGHTSHRG